MAVEWLNLIVLGNEIWRYGVILIVIAIAVLIYWIVSRFLNSLADRPLSSMAQKLYQQTTTLTKRPLKFVLLTGIVWMILRLLHLPEEVRTVGNYILMVLASVAFIYLAIKLVNVIFVYLQVKAEKTKSRLDDQLIPLIGKGVKIFIWIVGVLLVIQNIGINVTGLIAGLGIGGLALALAAQDTLSNLFGATTLFVDHPFCVGDIVRMEGYVGTVETIGMRSTRIRTFDGTLVTIPNKAAATAVIENIDARLQRRTNFQIGVTYDTSYDKLKQALEILRNIMREHPATGQSRAYFNQFGDFSLNILVHHWCIHLEFEKYLQTLEEINLEIKRQFDEADIEFAFPTQTIHLPAAERLSNAAIEWSSPESK